MSEEKKQAHFLLVGLITALAAFGGYYLVHVYVFGKKFELQDYIIASGIAIGVVVANFIQRKKMDKKKQEDLLDD